MERKLQFGFTKTRFLPLMLFTMGLLMVTSFEIFGQSAVKGSLTTTDDNSPIIYATVVVKGTTTGVTSDFNGEYILPLKPGTYTLLYSYMGYETKEEKVTIEANKTTILNMRLSPSLIMGEEVIVTAQARGQIGAVNQQLRSNQIINVVSAERIRELPDENAAQAISRLPGITLDGSKVVIRGIESKMNKIMINGIEMPSTDGQNRSTDLGIVSANMLSGIEVFKTLTPDMDADAIGGTINLRMRSASAKFHASLTTQATYNPQEDIVGKKMVWADVSNRFFDNKFGVLLNMNFEAQKGGNDWVTSSYVEQGTFPIGDPRVKYQLKDVNVYDQQTLNSNVGGSVVLDYKLPRGQIVYTGMLSHTTPEDVTYRDNLQPSSNYRYFLLSHSKYNSLLLNNSIRLDQQIGIVKLDASISLVSIDREDDYRYTVRFKDANVSPFQKDSITLDRMLTMQPWQVYSTVDTNSIKEFKIQDNDINPNQYSENQFLADLNIQIPVKISNSIDVNFRLGGKYNKKDREFDQDFWEYNTDNVNVNKVNDEMAPWFAEKGINYLPGAKLLFSNFQDKDYKTNKSFMNNSPYYNMDYVIDVDLIDEMFLRKMNLDPKTTNLIRSSAIAQNDYWGTETKVAGYAMAEIKLGKKFVIIPGVRVESLTSDFSAFKSVVINSDTWETDSMNTKVTTTYFFPHFHARYSVSDWWDIRFSYNKTISRPDYIDQIPMVTINLSNLTGSAGNPFIKPALSENFDANLTFYTLKMGLFTVGGYIKTIKDIFYPQATQIKNIPDTLIRDQFPTNMFSNQIDYYLNSPFTAYVKGMEIEWQSNFSWLPAPFNGIVLNTNYSHIWSETEYMQNRILYVKPPGGLVKLPVESDTSFVNRLLNQGNDIANISLGYDNKGFSARLSFRFQGNVISKIGSRIEENEYTNNIYAYDFVVKQKIPIKFADFEVFLNAINFTNVPRMRYSIFPNKGETNTYTRYSGAQFQLGLRLKY
jgi:TonB-dependent receptor